MDIQSDTVKVINWLADNPEVKNLRVGVCDLNGVIRGKLIPVEQVQKALDGAMRMPLSATSVDIWGNDIAESKLVYQNGDADGILNWTGHPILPMTWLHQPTGLLPLWMAREDGGRFEADPRCALAAVLDRFADKGLTPVVATELEFYLFDPTAEFPAPPKSARTGGVRASNAVLAIDEIDHFDDFFNDVYSLCKAQGIPADAAIAEGGAGQFEINLLHRPDALAAGDDAMLFKKIVKGVAQKHGLAASFMAKPYTDRAGCGLHVHFSLLDDDGNNVFDNGGKDGSRIMKHAVAGLLAAMAESTLIFAPHLNSYRRLKPHTHAPSVAAWGYENRHAAIRIPGGAPVARRIEHRVAGADANPYLVLAAILGAALYGIENKLEPPAPVDGDVFVKNAQALPQYWRDAIDRFESGSVNAKTFSPLLCDLLVACKRQEYRHFSEQLTPLEFITYLDAT